MTLTAHMVDVFGSEPLAGNPVAVIDGADDLTTAQMQSVAQWFNLSETTFLLPPTRTEADYRVRIFTPAMELPFAGHPTLGTCHAWISSTPPPARIGTFVQECAAGLICLHRDEITGTLSFAAPPLLRFGEPTADELSEALEFLKIGRHAVHSASWLDNGAGWLGIRLRSATDVLELEPHRSWPRMIDVGVVGEYPPNAHAAFEVRAFFGGGNGDIIEDPVTGSLNAALGQWLIGNGSADRSYIAAQGTRIGRTGRVHISSDETGQVWVGGRTHTHVTGQFTL